MAGVKNRIKDLIPDSILLRRLRGGPPNSVLLTFDDGPDPATTPLVLDKLMQFHARAIFFVIGRQVEAHPNLLRRILAEGHLIGNHTYSHPYPMISGFARVRREIERCQHVCHEHTGIFPKWYRSPQGTVTLSGLVAAGSLGLTSMLWRIEGGERGMHADKTAQQIGSRLCDETLPGDIILLHDAHPISIDVLEIILPHFQSVNYNLESAVAMMTSAEERTGIT